MSYEPRTFTNESGYYEINSTINGREFCIIPNFTIREVVDSYQAERLTADPYNSVPEEIESHLEIDEWDIGTILEQDEEGFYNECEVSEEEYAECKKICKEYVDSLIKELEL